ncbi:31940_t:CDS:2 [Gigaspora margarita]|uniref:31940_t:CDS:1 n=1 Tax=Gigaspora margarita TaxID=4874 RepID=A0ABM8VZJ8_GIGMA|nr:31940_t:CDS:2 [Gigaspora margarita]
MVKIDVSCANDIYISTVSKEISDYVPSSELFLEINKRSTRVELFVELSPEEDCKTKIFWYVPLFVANQICDAGQVSSTIGLTINSSRTIAVMKLFKEKWFSYLISIIHLQKIYKYGIVHGNLHLRNICYDDFHKTVIADFGASSLILKNNGPTIPEKFYAILQYIAPEL